jgi:hypothetical protein
MIKQLWGAIRETVRVYNLEKKRARELPASSAPGLSCIETNDSFEITTADGRSYTFAKEQTVSEDNYVW